MQIFPPIKKILLLCLLFAIVCFPSGQTSAKRGSFFTVEPAVTGQTVLVQAPSLTPPYTTQCASGWQALPYDGGKTAYLALNAQTGSATHSGEWRPSLGTAGLYRVEVFIPDHGAIEWPCGIDKTIASDTTKASYTISHSAGETTVVIDQKPVQSAWVSLGAFWFAAGSAGHVRLTNVTGEASQTSTVSFASARFTPLEQTFFPTITNGEKVDGIDLIWTADNDGKKKNTFLPGEKIRYAARVSNKYLYPVEISFAWTQKGPCGPTSLTTGSQYYGPGTWTITYESTAPACQGNFIATVELKVAGEKSTLQTKFDTGFHSTFPAFDKCGPPSPSQLQTWWNFSPYGVKNLYIGGISYACKNSILNKSWVETVSKQGWSFILTWVGPQASCSQYNHKMSSDSSKAYQQGKDEADAAIAAAKNLGFTRQPTIFYDLENYNAADSKCHKAAKEFLRGWVQRLHSEAALAGVYGGCLSRPTDWATISPSPDQVWLANWILPAAYDPHASVWNVSCVENSLWPTHQRIRQYAGGHTETWGGVTMTVDSNATDAPMMGSTNMAAAAVVPQETQLVDRQGWPVIRDMQWLTPETGWVIAGETFFTTQDGGQQWQWSGLPTGGAALVASFTDTQHGWVLSSNPAGSGLVMMETVDGGETWEQTPIAIDFDASEIDTVELQRQDGQSFSLSVKLKSGSGISLGVLLRSLDGGQTWQKSSLPFAGKVHFFDAQAGILAEGPYGNELYLTRDGGLSWESAAGLNLGQAPDDQVFIKISAPGESLGDLAQLEVTISNPAGSRIELYSSSDYGTSWTLKATQQLAPSVEPGSSLPSTLTMDHRILLLPRQQLFPELEEGASAGAVASVDLPAGTREFVLLDNLHGWAWSVEGVCQGDKAAFFSNPAEQSNGFACSQSFSLWKTLDGGSTWILVQDPA